MVLQERMSKAISNLQTQLKDAQSLLEFFTEDSSAYITTTARIAKLHEDIGLLLIVNNGGESFQVIFDS